MVMSFAFSIFGAAVFAEPAVAKIEEVVGLMHLEGVGLRRLSFSDTGDLPVAMRAVVSAAIQRTHSTSLEPSSVYRRAKSEPELFRLPGVSPARDKDRQS